MKFDDDVKTKNLDDNSYVVPDKERALRLIAELNEWCAKVGAELRLDVDGNVYAVVELR